MPFRYQPNRRRTSAQKHQTSVASHSAGLKRDENTIPIHASDLDMQSGRTARSIRPSASALSLAPSTSSPPSFLKLAKSLRNKISYRDRALKQSRNENRASIEDQQIISSSLQATNISLASANEELAHTKQDLYVACSLLCSTQDQLEITKGLNESSFNDRRSAIRHQHKSAQTLKDAQRLDSCNKALAKRLRAATKRLARMHMSCERMLSRQRKKLSTRRILRLKANGIYSMSARSIARTLVGSGCAQKKVGPVIQAVGKALGIVVHDSMSKRTVRRAIIEGGVASTIQVGHTIVTAKCEFSIFSDEVNLIS